MNSLFLDSSVILLALGRPSPERDACQGLLASATTRRVHIGAETVQEVLFHRLRIGGRARALAQVQWLRTIAVVHRMDDPVIDRAVELVASTRARGRDAFIAATALEAGFDSLVTSDERFVAVPGLSPVHPRDVRA